MTDTEPGGADKSARRLYSAEWYSGDGLCDAEVRATSPDGYWPGMVILEISAGSASFGGTLTTDDARELATHILCAVDSADHANREAARARRVSGASVAASTAGSLIRS